MFESEGDMMSNQRPGKYKPAKLREDGMALVRFFASAKEALDKRGEEDASFYFEQVEDWLRDGNSLEEDPRKILGL